MAVLSLLANGTPATAQGPVYVPSKLRLLEKQTFLEAPRPGTRVVAGTFYTEWLGRELVSLHTFVQDEGKTSTAFRRRSEDNGRTWSQAEEVPCVQRRDGAKVRRYIDYGWVDPDAGVLVQLMLEGAVPADGRKPGEWSIRYRLSSDGGRTHFVEKPIVHWDVQYTPNHPLPGVWTDRNPAAFSGTSRMVRLSTGKVVQPVQVPRSGEGENRVLDCAVLLGTWAADHSDITWDMSEYVRGDPDKTADGLFEPTVAAMSGGRVLMVMRGSNGGNTKLQARRWYAVSEDDGRTWSEARPWTYHDGTPFYSPSSPSQLVAHGNGRWYWVGNISPRNCDGAAPRYPLVLGEVDPESMLLRKDTLCTLDDREERDGANVQLAVTLARQDRDTRQILVHVTPYGRGAQAACVRALKRKLTKTERFWTGDATVYRVDVDPVF